LSLTKTLNTIMKKISAIIVLISFICCTNSQTNTIEKISEIDYNKYFNKKMIENIPVEVIDLGTLSLPTGEIVACDPLVNPETRPFSRKVTPGEYNVKIYVAKTKNSGNRIAFAKLEFSDQKTDKWVLATLDGEDISKLKKDEYFGFSVDAGLGSFFDYQSGIAFNNFLENFYKQKKNTNIYDDLLAREFKKNARNQDDPQDIGDWLNFKIPNKNLNIIMFSSGYGDGNYPAYWGLTNDGIPTSLIIDFQIFN
jgi:hypothetical protein